MNKFIGIDVSKKTLDIAILFEDSKDEWFKVSNNLYGFNELLKVLDTSDFVIMEATGSYYYKLAYFLHNKGIKVSVENPLIIKRFCQMELMRAKTDKKDALMIAKYGKLVRPKAWIPTPEVIQQIKQKHSAIELLEKHITALSNQLEAFDQWGVKDRSTIQSIRAIKQSVQRKVDKLENEMKKLVLSNYTQTYESLTSIPGIGNKTAIALIAITNDFSKFESYKQLTSYVGLSPRIFQSGTSVRGKSRICKMGMSRVRKLLYMCAWSAKRNNYQCVEFYTRLKERGKPEKVIKIAIANKLLKQAFTIATKQICYDKNFQNKFGF